MSRSVKRACTTVHYTLRGGGGGGGGGSHSRESVPFATLNRQRERARFLSRAFKCTRKSPAALPSRELGLAAVDLGVQDASCARSRNESKVDERAISIMTESPLKRDPDDSPRLMIVSRADSHERTNPMARSMSPSPVLSPPETYNRSLCNRNASREDSIAYDR